MAINSPRRKLSARRASGATTTSATSRNSWRWAFRRTRIYAARQSAPPPLNPQPGPDWAQAFLRQRAAFVGNTGYGYGDSDLIAYSERVIANFVEELGDWSEGPQTIGRALLRAKQRYYNTAAAGSFGNYDEKALSEVTLYGLPMLRISMPITTAIPPDRQPVAGRLSASEVVTTPMSFTFSYVTHTLGAGTYYLVAGDDDVHVA